MHAAFAGTGGMERRASDFHGGPTVVVAPAVRDLVLELSKASDLGAIAEFGFFFNNQTFEYGAFRHAQFTLSESAKETDLARRRKYALFRVYVGPEIANAKDFVCSC